MSQTNLEDAERYAYDELRQDGDQTLRAAAELAVYATFAGLRREREEREHRENDAHEEALEASRDFG